jgi:hypothetical protein
MYGDLFLIKVEAVIIIDKSSTPGPDYRQI